MIVPLGIMHFPNQVCKLNKSLYGLKQASRKWYENLTYVFTQQRYTQASSNHSLFIQKTFESFTVILVYVDVIILAENSSPEF